MNQIRYSQLIAESNDIEAMRYVYLMEGCPKLKIYEKGTSKLIESITSKGIEKDLEYVLKKYPAMVSCLDEE